MTIDERLDRLVERHEALSQTVEMLAVGQLELQASHRELQAGQLELQAGHRELQKEMKTMMAAITLLAKTAANHEGRITDIEGGRAS